MSSRLGTTAVLTIAGVAILVGTAGCTAAAPDPTATPAPTASSPAATAEATPAPSAPPTLRPTLSADENLAYFDAVNLAVVAANPSAGGRDFIDALVAAGFDRSQMEVTFDRTTVDLEADSVQFAVLFQGECLIGQYGPATDGYHSAVRPPLGTGGCLIGQTRPIDW
ncbi:hypothetical protein [Agromyces sp. H66]|uniref:DUF6993 domain-containing protein n=1 Tax=Agromyces sp. H66 TaxID=2529859 RepID=UPI0010AA176B|nr:hypothetical protein [Agromyces sp. H66]